MNSTKEFDTFKKELQQERRKFKSNPTKTGFRKFALKYHPDKLRQKDILIRQLAETVFKEISDFWDKEKAELKRKKRGNGI